MFDSSPTTEDHFNPRSNPRPRLDSESTYDIREPSTTDELSTPRESENEDTDVESISSTYLKKIIPRRIDFSDLIKNRGHFFFAWLCGNNKFRDPKLRKGNRYFKNMLQLYDNRVDVLSVKLIEFSSASTDPNNVRWSKLAFAKIGTVLKGICLILKYKYELYICFHEALFIEHCNRMHNLLLVVEQKLRNHEHIEYGSTTPSKRKRKGPGGRIVKRSRELTPEEIVEKMVEESQTKNPDAHTIVEESGINVPHPNFNFYEGVENPPVGIDYDLVNEFSAAIQLESRQNLADNAANIVDVNPVDIPEQNFQNENIHNSAEVIGTREKVKRKATQRSAPTVEEGSFVLLPINEVPPKRSRVRPTLKIDNQIELPNVAPRRKVIDIASLVVEQVPLSIFKFPLNTHNVDGLMESMGRQVNSFRLKKDFTCSLERMSIKKKSKPSKLINEEVSSSVNINKMGATLKSLNKVVAGSDSSQINISNTRANDAILEEAVIRHPAENENNNLLHPHISTVNAAEEFDLNDLSAANNNPPEMNAVSVNLTNTINETVSMNNGENNPPLNLEVPYFHSPQRGSPAYPVESRAQSIPEADISLNDFRKFRTFGEFARGKTRRQVASAFVKLLHLKKERKVEIIQEEAFGPITIQVVE